MNRIAQILTRRTRPIILGCALLTLGLALGIPNLKTRNNYEGDLPAADPIVRTSARFEAIFGSEHLMMLAVESPGLLSPENLEKIHRISTALAAVEGVPAGGVTSPTTLPAEGGASPGLISEDGSTALILTRIDRHADQTTVARQVRDIVREFEGPERIYTIGDLTVAQDIDDGIENDLQTLLPLALILILAGFYASFRSLTGVLFPLLVILLSITWTLGLMGHLGIPLNVVTSTIPLLLVAAASSYGIHVVHRHNEEHRTGGPAARRLLVRLGPPLCLTGLTSVLGTLTLLVFRIASIREYGVFAACGLLFATVLALVLAPAIPGRPGRPGAMRAGRGDRLLTRLGNASLNHPRPVFALALLIAAVSAIGVSRIRMGLNPSELFPENHPVRTSAQVFNERFGGCRYIDIMVEAAHPGAVFHPAFLRSLQNFQRAAEHIPRVSSARSILDILPHPAPEPAQIEQLLNAPAGAQSLAARVDKDRRRAAITVTITTTDHEEQAEIYRRLQTLSRAHFPEPLRVEFGGPVLLWIAQNRYVAIGKIFNIAAALCLVLSFCAVAFRSAVKGLLCVVPLTLATLATFGLMGFFGIRLNMATAIITSLAVGIGVDFAIHYFSRLQQELARGHTPEHATRRTMRTAGKAICFDAGSNILGFSVFCFSGFSPIRNLGWLISVTMLTCALATLVLLPPLAARVLRKKAPRHDRTPEPAPSLQPIGIP